jgi:hypothetical protein
VFPAENIKLPALFENVSTFKPVAVTAPKEWFEKLVEDPALQNQLIGVLLAAPLLQVL